MTGWRIVKKTYSRSPWRVVTADGQEVNTRQIVVNVGASAFSAGIPMPVGVAGHDTKQEAVEALGDVAARLWDRLNDREEAS